MAKHQQIGDKPMTASERSARKRHMDKAKLARLAELEAENDALLAQNERLLAYVREMAGLESPK